MSILSFSTHREIVSWLVWLLVLVIILLRACFADPTGYPAYVCQSSFDPVPGLKVICSCAGI